MGIGFRKVVDSLFPRTTNDEFDVRNGTDTSSVVPRWRLRIKHGVRYQCSSEESVVRALNWIDQNGSEATFVDVGCGKGRILIVAARYGFGKVIGVEASPSLVRIAKSNMRITKTGADVVLANAANFRFPNGPLVVFMYNPFSEVVMSRVVDNLRQHDGPIWIIYDNPKCAHLFDSCSFLRRDDCPDLPGFAIWQDRALNPGMD